METSSCSSDHLMALNMLRRDPATSWVFAVPSVVTRHKQCDQLPEDYRRAGIGHCMSGDDGSLLSLSGIAVIQDWPISIFISVKPKSHKNAQCNNENSSLPPYYAKLVRMRFSLPPRDCAAKHRLFVSVWSLPLCSSLHPFRLNAWCRKSTVFCFIETD